MMSYLELWQTCRTIYAILVEGIMGNIHFKFEPVVQEDMSFKEKNL